MTPTLGRIIHVRPFNGTTTTSEEWWAAIVVSVGKADGVQGVFSARALDPSGAAGDTTRLLIGGDEGKTWRWPPRDPAPAPPRDP